MSAAHWAGSRLFLGKVLIGMVSGDWTPGPNGERWAGLSYLPGAGTVLGPFADEKTARDMVMKSAQSRVKAMFGAGIETTATAVNSGRKLRVVARAIWRAGVWYCDRPVDHEAMFSDLGRALGFSRDDAPLPKTRPKQAAAPPRLPRAGIATGAAPPPEPDDVFEPV